MSAIIYLLQVSACLALFYGFYYLMLNRLTFFTINRYYLLFTLILSFTIPLLTIPVSQHYSAVPVMQQIGSFNSAPDAVSTVSTPVKTDNPITWMQLLSWGYLAAVSGLFLHLLITLANFFAKLKSRKISSLGNVHILRGDKTLPNGSFLNYIFLNENELSAQEMEQIVAHEMLHVKLFHSADRILMKLVQIILWFNPFVYFYARSMEENHEFEVDREVALSTDKTQYADLLLHLSVANQGMLYHSFSKVPLKKRITMLFNKPSANMKKITYILIIPVLVISCLAFAKLKTQDLQPKTRLSVIGGLDIVGKNPLVLINGKAYPSDILYKIGSRYIKGTGIFSPDDAVKKYGKKAKDGVVEIFTKDGKISYMTPIDRENLIKEASIPKTQFFARITLKKENGTLYDEIIIHPTKAGKVAAGLSHGGKAVFYIDKKMYDENAMRTLSPKIIASLTGSYSTGGARPGDKLKGFELEFIFNTNIPTDKSSDVKKPIVNKTSTVAKLDSGNKPSFYTRVRLKKENGESFERITLTRDGRMWGSGDMPLGGKFTLMLNNKIYSENDIRNFSPEFIDLIRKQNNISVTEAGNDSGKEFLKGTDVLFSITGNIPEPKTL